MLLKLQYYFPVVSVALWSIWSLIGPSFSGPAFSVDSWWWDPWCRRLSLWHWSNYFTNQH